MHTSRRQKPTKNPTTFANLFSRPNVHAWCGYLRQAQDLKLARPLGRAPRPGRGGRRFKSCHSDQHLADFLKALPTDIPTETVLLRSRPSRAIAALLNR